MPDMEKAQRLAIALNNTIAANYPEGKTVDSIEEIVMAAGVVASSHISLVSDSKLREKLLHTCIIALRKTARKFEQSMALKH